MQPRVFIKLPIILTVAGPVFTAGSSFSNWGLDATFYRDWRQNYALPGSLVRGKLRESMELIESQTNAGYLSVQRWFGIASGNEDDKSEPYVPHRGILKVSDFIFKPETSSPIERSRIRNRIRIEPERLVVEKGALLSVESPFISGGRFDWEGSVEFSGREDDYKSCIHQIKQAFVSITAFGADKTIGCGRLLKVTFGNTEIIKLPPKAVTTTTQAPLGCKLSLKPLEPLLIGGIRRTDNIFESEAIIPGALIKGTLAAGLNRLAGVDLNQSIDENNEEVNKLFPGLSKHFENIRILHAVPADNKFERKQLIPLSFACYGNECENVAFKDNLADVWAKGKMPVRFQVDWKGIPDQLPDDYKGPKIQYHQVTRTAIDNNLLKADEGMLYSFKMIKPDDQISWTTSLQFPSSCSQEERHNLYAELQQVLTIALRYIGKRQSRIDIIMAPLKKTENTHKAHSGKDFSITLQTPAIMLNPNDLVQESQIIFDDQELMHQLYTDYWRETIGESFIMKRIFATQELQGGYLGMRYIKDKYRPFYLTSTGSTFVFSQNGSQDWHKLDLLCENGLPLPNWAAEEYGVPFWKNCPFVPENGFAEIKVHFKP
jgi:RAMP superfamily